MKKLNKAGPSTDPWGTPLATGIQLSATDDYPLSSAIQPVLNPPHWPLIQPTLPELPWEDVMGDRVESLAEVEVENIPGSPFVYPASHVIVESYQIGQAWFPLGESMLTTPDNLLFFHLLQQSWSSVIMKCP